MSSNRIKATEPPRHTHLDELVPLFISAALDHVALDESVIACDMAATPLGDSALDVAVFSLSLMGENWRAYLREACRTLKPYGYMLIAEPAGRWQDKLGDLRDAMESSGLRMVGDSEERFGFVYLAALKL